VFASLHSERGTRRLEQHLYITADRFACVVLAGVYSAQKYWLTDFLTISAKDATGCLHISGFGEGCVTSAASEAIIATSKTMQRISRPSAGRLKVDLHLCVGLELQHEAAEER
jgi:hypothetical protein